MNWICAIVAGLHFDSNWMVFVCVRVHYSHNVHHCTIAHASLDYLHRARWRERERENAELSLGTERIYKTYELWAHLKQVISHTEFIVDLFFSSLVYVTWKLRCNLAHRKIKQILLFDKYVAIACIYAKGCNSHFACMRCSTFAKRQTTKRERERECDWVSSWVTEREIERERERRRHTDQMHIRI